MPSFSKILFVSHISNHDVDALRQAMALSAGYGADIKILILHPDLPDSLKEHSDTYKAALIDKMKQAALAAGIASLPEGDIIIESGKAQAIRVIQRVLRDGFDLVIKAADFQEGNKGFKAFDMELLRKCPCPVWLCRKPGTKIAVAVDPNNDESAGRDLSIKLLQTAQNLAQQTPDATLEIVSCWAFEQENYLRGNAWIKMSDEEIDLYIHNAQAQHDLALKTLVESAGDIDAPMALVRGAPEIAIPGFVDEHNIDLLIMGTVARTGIPGFIIGNTAENILQKLSCSLLALKPNGFVSPIKAY
jgi:universal stress protein E